ncbi:hypothetical protein Acr_26g0015260 [Actinidia rufa]|uniref:NB-ARC domain-containing disease resistance protein n=1 Tax=Actinidia rufa TaxID=165716 RepID=A0A7J0H578_9ERIC|nr:hypothetical protein Acr_26g0015260 [Actinidia rufa]
MNGRKCGVPATSQLCTLSPIKTNLLTSSMNSERMKAFIKFADAMEEIDPELKVWVKQVREAAYDIGDASKARHQIASEIQVVKSRVVNISKGHKRYVALASSQNWSPMISPKVAYLRTLLTEVKRVRHSAWNLAKLSPLSARPEPKCSLLLTLWRGRPSSIRGLIPRRLSNIDCWLLAPIFYHNKYDCRGDAHLLEEAELVGIEKPKSRLIGWLVHGDPRLQVFSVVGIVSIDWLWLVCGDTRLQVFLVVGMKGLGKTTLVRKVFDDAVVKKFQNHAWITVSESFKIKELLKDMIQ